MIVREVWPFIILGIALTTILMFTAVRWNNFYTFLLSVILAVLTLFSIFFFRDPERTCPTEPNVLVAPADGKIVAIERLENHPFVGGPATQVSIFLSVFDVHVNRVPSEGVIDYVNYNKGKFLAAFNDKASMDNEQTEIGMTTESGHRIVFKQIAGLIARRIVCNLKAEDTVSCGDRFGLIRFGSRADLIVPEGTEITVKKGDRVKGGESIMARLKENAPTAGPDKAAKGEDGQL